jgi:hypothetical protein
MNDKVTVTKIRTGCAYNQNCIKYVIRFSGTLVDQGQYKIIPGLDKPLKGDFDPSTQASLVKFEQSTIQAPGGSLFYDAIPFEFLRTYVEEPQIIVKVDNEPAVCHSINCNFKYIVAQAKVSTFAYDDTIKELTLTGVTLPNGKNIISIKFAL